MFSLPRTTTILGFCLAVAFSKNASAQDFNFKVTCAQNFPSEFSYPHISGDSTGYDAIALPSQGKIHFGHFDGKLTLVRSVESLTDERGTFADVVFQRNEILYFYSLTDRAKRRKDLFVDVFSRISFAKISSMKVAEINYGDKAGSDDAVFNVKRKGGNILVFYQTPAEPEVFRFSLFDENLVEKRTIVGNFSEENKVLQNWIVTMDGTGQLAMSLLQKDKRSGSGEKYSYSLRVFESSSNSFKKIALPMQVADDSENGGLFNNVTSLLFYHVAKDRIFLFRYMLQSGELTRAEITDAQMKSKAVYYDTKGGYADPAQAEPRKPLQYIFKGMVMKDDGSILYVSEQAFEEPGFSRHGSYHHNNNVQVVQISPANEVLWTTRIVKRQSGRIQYDPYVSVSLVNTRGKHFLMFNDYAGMGDKVLTMPTEDKLARNSSFLMRFDENGRPETKSIFSSDSPDARPFRTAENHGGVDAVLIAVKNGLYRIDFN